MIFAQSLSRLLRYDLSRRDMIKWVDFARQALGLVLASVVLMAGVSAYFSIHQARKLLEESLSSQARAIAEAVARAAFIPLSLEDQPALEDLVEPYRMDEHVGSLVIRDAQGRSVRGFDRIRHPKRVLRVQVPILPAEEEEPERRRPAGFVELGMRTDWISAKQRDVALANIAISGALSLFIFAVGIVGIGILVDRTRELVGEARLVEEVRRANEELESFSYSVAHDLRAPLRAIDGFSQILLENYGDRLDDAGKDFLGRVHAASQRMGLLISDLLMLSRITSGSMRSESVDLSAVARQIAGELKDAQPERKVEFVIAEGLRAQGDPSLVRVALQNLLGNAWKYTSHHPRARIEFGLAAKNGGQTYFVRDDGAGFEMTYAEKLFKPFSRLHPTQEFEGTGIGLATVKRVVEKHGGRIWGEGEPDKGATFYFTLPEART